MLTEYHTHEIATLTESQRWEVNEFGTAGEVDSKGVAGDEGSAVHQTYGLKVGAPQVELN